MDPPAAWTKHSRIEDAHSRELTCTGDNTTIFTRMSDCRVRAQGRIIIGTSGSWVLGSYILLLSCLQDEVLVMRDGVIMGRRQHAALKMDMVSLVILGKWHRFWNLICCDRIYIAAFENLSGTLCRRIWLTKHNEALLATPSFVFGIVHATHIPMRLAGTRTHAGPPSRQQPICQVYYTRLSTMQ